MRKKILVLLVLSAAGAAASEVQFSTIQDFIAPIFYDVTTITSPAPGLIVYDSKDNSFKGKTGNSASTWQTLSPTSVAGAVNTSVNNTYAIVGTDDFIEVDTTANGAFTVTLPSAVANVGKFYRIKKVNSSTTAVTIATSNSQTIDGNSTVALNFQYEHITVLSDGANWLVTEHYFPNKQYTLSVGTTTPTGWSTTRAVGTVYVTSDGTWHLKFNVEGTLTAASAPTLNFVNVTFKNVTSMYQAVTAADISAGNISTYYARTQPNSSSIAIAFTAISTSIIVSGDVELDAKPAFAL